MSVASTPGTEFATGQRKKEGEKERDEKEGKEAADTGWLLLSILSHLSAFLGTHPSLCAVPVFGNDYPPPTPGLALIGPKESQCPDTLPVGVGSKVSV